jgi:hypothetical protein
MWEPNTLQISARSIILLAGIALAATAKSSKALRAYFVVQFATGVVLELVLNSYGWQATAYRVAYSVSTVLIVAASWLVVRTTRPRLGVLAKAFLHTSLLWGIAFACLPPVRTVDTWTLMAAAPCVLFLGMVLARQCWQDHIILGPLALLWLALGCFFFAIAVHPDSEFWTGAEEWFSYWAMFAVSLWCGWMLRVRHTEVSDLITTTSHL